MKKLVFNEGTFHEYKVSSLNEARAQILLHSAIKEKVTIFISHKHSDLNELMDVIGFLEKKYDVKCYIDSEDAEMPTTTSMETANLLKRRIQECKKFILLATEDAIESVWCNWELGFGDANKYKEHIALFPIKKKHTKENDYNGKEYMKIYPHITYWGENETYKNGKTIIPGYYIRRHDSDGCYKIESLESWLNK